MRTAIFVYEPTTVTITTSETNLQLISFDGKSDVVVVSEAALPVVPTIYKIVSSSQVLVGSASSKTQVLDTSNDKDEFPDPPLALPSTMVGTSTEAIQSFFVIPDAKSLKLA